LDGVFVHGALFAVFMRPIAALLRLPMMVSSCEVLDRQPPALQKVIAACFAAARAGVVTAEVIRVQLRELGVPEAKVRVVPSGVRRDFFAAADAPQSIAPCDVLFWGDSKRERGFDVVVRLAEALPHLRFRALLRWQDRNCMHELARFKALANTEALNYPYAHPLAAYLRAARLIVLPFRFITVRPPLSVLEAMAAGRCVVTTPMPGNEELIRHDDTGFLIDFDAHPQQGAAFIADLLVDRVRRERIERAARAHAERLSETARVDFDAFGARPR